MRNVWTRVHRQHVDELKLITRWMLVDVQA